MNFTKGIVVLICSLSLANTAIAADPKASKDLGPTAGETELIGLGWRVSKLKGEDVYNDAKEKYGTAGAQMKSAVQAAIDKYQARKG